MNLHAGQSRLRKSADSKFWLIFIKKLLLYIRVVPTMTNISAVARLGSKKSNKNILCPRHFYIQGSCFSLVQHGRRPEVLLKYWQTSKCGSLPGSSWLFKWGILEKRAQLKSFCEHPCAAHSMISSCR